MILLIRWPTKITAGTTEDELVQNLDFVQTFPVAAGISAPEDMQGESLLPLLPGKKENWKRDALYYHYYEYPSVHMVKGTMVLSRKNLSSFISTMM